MDRVGLRLRRRARRPAWARSVRVGDVVLVLVLMAMVLVEWAIHRSPTPLEAVAAVWVTVPLLARRVVPVVVVCVVAAAFATSLLAPEPALAANVAMLVAAYSGVVHARTRRGVVVVCVAAAVGWTLGVALVPGYDLTGRVVSAAWIAAPLGVGAVVRDQVRRAAGAEARSAQAAAVLAEERDRIAREMHDVVAHALAVVVLHARGGREALRHGDGGAADGAFAVVEASSRQALGDMRRLVGLLRDPQDELGAPSLQHLEDLVDGVRGAGVPIDLCVVGDRTGVPAGIDAAAYRLVQEALTNVIKHAEGAATRVRVVVAGQAIELEVEDDGPRAAPAVAGHGLVGMRERVEVYGGRFESGPRPTGGFRVWARMPLEVA